MFFVLYIVGMALALGFIKNYKGGMRTVRWARRDAEFGNYGSAMLLCLAWPLTFGAWLAWLTFEFIWREDRNE